MSVIDDIYNVFNPNEPATDEIYIDFSSVRGDRNSIDERDLPVLIKVYQTKKIINNDEQYQKLLANRCILVYSYLDDDEEIQTWYDINPLIEKINEFQEALSKLSP